MIYKPLVNLKRNEIEILNKNYKIQDTILC